MKAMKIISALITIFVSLPIWYWLVYQILERVQATQLMWFLYFVYMPCGLFTAFLTRIAESAIDK